MNSTAAGCDCAASLVSVADIEQVIAIDRAHTGRSRRGFFEKRFATAAAHPQDFIAIGIPHGDALIGRAVAGD